MEVKYPIRHLINSSHSLCTFFNLGKKPPGEAENLRDLRMARSKRKVSS